MVVDGERQIGLEPLVAREKNSKGNAEVAADG